jgi:hypothetical protein
MIALFKHKWNRMAIRMAIVCFFLATALMLSALMANTEMIVTCGIVCLVLYIPLTLGMLCILFINTLINFKDIHEHVMTLIIVLINFPIVLLYINFTNP